jgi:hypothetical protein
MVKAAWRKLTAGEREVGRVKTVHADAQSLRTTERVEQYVAGLYEHLGVDESDDAQESSYEPPAIQYLPPTRQGRKGRGVIDKFGFPAGAKRPVQEISELREYNSGVVGPASGLPPPQPDPSVNPPLDRSTRIRTETATWTGIIQEQGRLELSRVNEAGNQEWLSAVEVYPREWRIQKSKTTHHRHR